MCASSGELTVSMRHWYFSLFMGGYLVCRPGSWVHLKKILQGCTVNKTFKKVVLQLLQFSWDCLFQLFELYQPQNNITCLRHCRFYHQRLFISLPVCLATRAYERPPTVVSPNPAWASFRTLSNHTTYVLSLTL